MSRLTSINFQRWLTENKHLLKPPVGNKCIHDGDLIVMVIGGPNARTDYHINQGEEFFFQIKGNMQLRIIENDSPRSIAINEGEIFILPAGVPHSPARPPDSIGLVIERKRERGQLDAFRWHCDRCHSLLYEESFQLENIATQFPPIFERFYCDPIHTTCKSCGTKMERPLKSAD
jgi:3-hydroxyanthranilate 3,4-dioxygenase